VELEKSKAAELAKGEFLANMSHEIRTPLNGVLGMAQILGDAEIDSENRKYLVILRRSAESLLSIVNDVLDFSKITSGKMLFETVPLDLRAILEDVVQIMKPAAAEKEITMEFTYSTGALRNFSGDPTRIRQLVLNLASNALKFTTVGHVSLAAIVTEQSTGHCDIVLRVADTGIGIPEDRLPAIFDQFEQVDASTSRTSGGTGLGLAISRQLARRMDGDIVVQSTLGEGSVFEVHLTLPVSSTSPTAVDQQAELPRFELEVLIAEDNKVNQLVIGSLLKKIGIDAVFAENGHDAIEELERRRYDLVFMDVRMPVMDGIEATRLIRNRTDSLADIPIIALTADADAESARTCRDAGMDLHLGKPVILSQIISAIDKLCVASPPAGKPSSEIHSRSGC